MSSTNTPNLSLSSDQGLSLQNPGDSDHKLQPNVTPSTNRTKGKTIAISIGGNAPSTPLNQPELDTNTQITSQTPLESTPTKKPQNVGKSSYDHKVVHAISSNEQLDDIIQGHEYVIVDFYADWCTPCQRATPVYTKLAAKYDTSTYTILFVKVDIDEFQDIADQYSVVKIPTFLIFHNGKVIRQSNFSELEFTMEDQFPLESAKNVSNNNAASSGTTAAPPTPVAARLLNTTTPYYEAQTQLMKGSTQLKIPPRPLELVTLLDSLKTHHLVLFYSSKAAQELTTLYSPTRREPFGFGDVTPTRSSSLPTSQVQYDDVIAEFDALCQANKNSWGALGFTAIDVDKQPALAPEFNITLENSPVVKLFYKKVVYLTFERCPSAKAVELKLPEFLALGS